MSQQYGRRCRTCKGLIPPPASVPFPASEVLAKLKAHTKTVMLAASEWDAISQDELTTAVEFARFLDFEAQRAAAYGDATPARADGRAS